jgi:short chain dehydrogenase
MDLGLKGKVAVITGGSVGIGLAIAEGLAAEGIRVVLAARGAERVHGEANQAATKYGVRMAGVACNVATKEGIDALIAAAVPRFFVGALAAAAVIANQSGCYATDSKKLHQALIATPISKVTSSKSIVTNKEQTGEGIERAPDGPWYLSLIPAKNGSNGLVTKPDDHNVFYRYILGGSNKKGSFWKITFDPKRENNKTISAIQVAPPLNPPDKTNGYLNPYEYVSSTTPSPAATRQ